MGKDRQPQPSPAVADMRGTSPAYRGCTELDRGFAVAARKPRVHKSGRKTASKKEVQPHTPPKEEVFAEMREFTASLERQRQRDQEESASEERAEKRAAELNDRQRGLAHSRDKQELKAVVPNYFRQPAGAFIAKVEAGGELVAEITRDAVKNWIAGAVGGVVLKGAAPVIGALIARGGVPIELGAGQYALYFEYLGGDVRYIGITNHFERRGLEHLRRAGREIQPIAMGLTLKEARGAEQLLIELYGRLNYRISGGSLSNSIGSISRFNPAYKELTDLGRAALRRLHWPGF